MIRKLLSLLGLASTVPTPREAHKPAWHRGFESVGRNRGGGYRWHRSPARNHGKSRRAHQLARVYRLRMRLSAKHAA